MRPLQDLAHVRILRWKPTTQGGLFLPHSATEQKAEKGWLWEAIVYDPPPGRKTKSGAVAPSQLKRGDHVLITQWWKRIPLDSIGEIDDGHCLVREDNVVAVIQQ